MRSHIKVEQNYYQIPLQNGLLYTNEIQFLMDGVPELFK